jgi:hypothetical protein
MFVQNLFFARPLAKLPSPPLFSIIGRCSPSLIIIVFHTSDLLFLPESEIRAGKLLVDPGHLQEEGVGGRPHYCYRGICCHRPEEESALQKIHILLMTMAKNYLKQLSL